MQHRPDLELGQDEPGQNGYPDLLVEGHPASTGASGAKEDMHSHSMQAGSASIPLQNGPQEGLQQGHHREHEPVHQLLQARTAVSAQG